MVDKIKGDTNVAEDSAFRYGHFTINGKRVEVPLQALDAKKYYESKIDFKDLKIDIAEVYRTYNGEKLAMFRKYPEEAAKEDRNLTLWKNKVGEKSIRFLFIRFEGEDYPNDEDIGSLINFSYSFSDATPIPSFPDVFKEKIQRINKDGTKKVDREGKPVIDTKIVVTEAKLKKHFDFLKRYIDTLNNLNHKDVLGIIPINIGGSNIEKLISFYYNNGINNFYLDLNSAGFDRLIDTALMWGILREIKRLGLEYQKTFFYSINGSPGRFQKGAAIVGSKDILTGGAGLDSVGRMHLKGMGKKKPIQFDPRVKEKEKLNRIRLFNKQDYGYYKLESKSIPFNLPKDSIIDKNLILDLNKGKKFADIFNMQQLSIENNNLRNYIKENRNPVSIIRKEKGKASPKDLSLIQRFKLKIKSLT